MYSPVRVYDAEAVGDDDDGILAGPWQEHTTRLPSVTYKHQVKGTYLSKRVTYEQQGACHISERMHSKCATGDEYSPVRVHDVGAARDWLLSERIHSMRVIFDMYSPVRVHVGQHRTGLCLKEYTACV